MTTDFNIVSGETVPSTYIWDIGTPLTTTPTRTQLKTSVPIITGYAPSLRVAFQSSVTDIPITTTRTTVISSEYIWNFGDFYNDVSNEISVQCPGTPVEHTYVMPGFYNVSLTTIIAKELIPDPIFTPRCYGKYRQGWFWNATNCNTETATTWNDTECESDIKPKWWNDENNCFGEYCFYWSWWATDKEETMSLNPVRWFQTRRAEEFTKKWKLEVNADSCEKELQTTFEVIEQTTIKQVVLVIEKLPIANILPITSPLTGRSPFSVRLSPKKIQTGSFPIDKVVWDFGDGSPLLSITRYSRPNNTKTIHTNTYFDDFEDPRNYDVVHTYKRTKDNFSMFYPSLTCYSANTGSSDCCSITIGPVFLPVPSTDFNLIAVNNTDKGLIYGIDFENTINFLTPSVSAIYIQNVQAPTAPIRLVRDSKVRYFGNPGNENYYLQYIPTCQQPFANRYIPNIIANEESVTVGLLLEDGITLLCL